MTHFREWRCLFDPLSVSVISLFHNHKEISRAYLDYWRRALSGFPNLELLFGDAASTDGTRSLVETSSDLGQCYLFDTNPGFAKGNNFLARKAKGDLLVFLNNDTLPCEGWLDEILALAEARPDLGIVGNLQLSVSTRLVDHAGVFFDCDGKPFHFRPPAGALNRLRWMPVPAVTGACLAVKPALFEKLGGFDEAFVNGYEDTDLCLRARELGESCWVATRSHVWHYVGASPGRHEKEEENKRVFLARWRPQAQQLALWQAPSLAHVPPQPCKHLLHHQTLQLFTPTPQGFQESHSTHRLHPENRWERQSFTLPLGSMNHILPLRLDPSRQTGIIRIGGVSLRSRQTHALLWQAKGEKLGEFCLNAGHSEAIGGRGFAVQSTGEDPQILISIPERFAQHPGQLVISIWIHITTAHSPLHRAAPPHRRGGRGLLVDLWRLTPGGGNGGIKVFVLEILRGLQALPGRTPITCVINPLLRPEISRMLPGADLKVLTEEAYFHGSHAWVQEYNVLYAPVHSTQLGHPGVRQISLVVDLLHRDFPQSLPAAEVFSRERLLVETLAASEYIQCNSRFVAHTLQHHYGLVEDQLLVVYNAVQHRLWQYRRGEAHRGSAPYFIYPANTWKHKNHLRLLEAFRLYRQGPPPHWNLLLTGSKVAGDCEGLPEELPLPEGCTWLGYLEDKDYFPLLAGAGALLFPSLYEGFGIPVLEALDLGVPVLCSNKTSLPEVGGDLVHYLNADSVKDMATAMQAVSSGRLPLPEVSREALSQRFAWEESLSQIRSALACV